MLAKYALLASVWLLTAKPLIALNPSLAISKFLHTSWTQEDGADLPAVQAIAQTHDGYLWLGSAVGLIRFDGVRFVHWKPGAGEKLPSSIRFLAPSAQRGLWVASPPGISRLDHGRLISYPAADRWLGGTVVAMSEDRQGRLWMVGLASARSLGVILPDDSFRIYDQAQGLPEQPIQTLYEDREHVFWLGTSTGLCRWSPGDRADCPSIPPMIVSSIVEQANGDLLVGDGHSRAVLRISRGTARQAEVESRYASFLPKTMKQDGDGNVWMGTAGQGLARLLHGRIERFTRREGLSGDNIGAIFEDREGDLWVGTARGIDRFRDPKVVHLNRQDGLSSDLITAVQAARRGGVWVGTYGGLNRVTATGADRYSTDSGLPDKTVFSLYEDRSGELWVATTAGLAHGSGNRFVPVRDAAGQSLDRVFAISGSENGALALADRRRGLFKVRDGVARPWPIPGSPMGPIYDLQFDRDGALWIGYFQGGVAAVTGNSARIYTTSDGLADGPVRTIYQDAAGAIWVGTGTGLSRFRNGSWTTWTARQGLPDGGVRGIVEDVPRHALWLVTDAALLRLSMAEVDAAGASANSLNFLAYGSDEGLSLAPIGDLINPPITASPDGRIWLSTQEGLAIVDPARIRSNPIPPPVVIEQMAVNGKALDLNSPGGVRFRGGQLQIAYTALSLVVPERIRFKYRLEGLDSGWTEAEARRTVAYVGLPPRRYRFHVIACNNDGLWNQEGAVLDLVVEPYYYQTWWFFAICAASIGLSTWGLHHLRVRRVVARVQLILQERTRMMRELHDSLLQGFAGVVYQLEAISRQFEAAPEVSRQRLERAIEQADQSLAEARRTMLSMRLPALENSTLPEALAATAAQLAQDSSIPVSFEVKGRTRQLHYDEQATLYLVGREAMTNSVNHARASRIAAVLTYSGKETRLTVHDDGSGFEPRTAQAKTDHWGLHGMRERAQGIGAAFVLDTAPGRGTRIEIVVPRK